jgi:hypothetical protein
MDNKISKHTIDIVCSAQNAFTERLKIYYDDNTPKNDSLYTVILQDTVIDKNGSCKDLLQFVDINNLFSKDTLIAPTLYRDDTRERTYFEVIILEGLKMQYKNFPIDEIKKLSTKKQVEFVKNWINKNL